MNILTTYKWAIFSFCILAGVLHFEMSEFSMPKNVPQNGRSFIVEINETDLKQLGPWPIERRWYALALEKLIDSGADSIFVYISFPQSDILRPESDSYFYEVLKTHPEIFIQYDEALESRDSVYILGNRTFPASRTIAPFSDSFTLGKKLIIMEDLPDNGLASHLLKNRNSDRSLALKTPEELSFEKHSLLDVIRTDTQLQQSKILVYLNRAGITSYLASQNNEPIPIPLLDWWAVHQIRQGNYLNIFPVWSYISISSLLIILGITFVYVDKKLVKWILGLVYIILILLLSVLYIANYYIPSYVFITAVITLILAVGISFYIAAIKPPLQIFNQYQPDILESDLRELEDLRYRVGFFEQLKTAKTLPTIEEMKPTGIVYHEDSPMLELLFKAREIAKSDIPVLITGESGTGKEELAKFIHSSSPRAEHAFVALNCGSLNENLIESELFGYEAGAFTGADRTKKGRFELADKGTLFLDEIAETNTGFQVRLLRVLQEGIFERVGGTDPIQTSVRIIAATHQNPLQLVEENRFREDLFYRLNGFSINLPPLRKRKMDIPVLFDYFLNKENKNKQYSESLVDWLVEQPWNGNIRELKTATMRAVVNSELDGREILLPKDFELGHSPSHSPDIKADTILSLIREYSSEYKFISIIAQKMDLHRVTVTEYLRGWIIKYLNETREDREVALNLSNGLTEEEFEAFQQRISNYIVNITRKIEAGINDQLDSSRIADQYFSQLPGYFSGDLKGLINRIKKEMQS